MKFVCAPDSFKESMSAADAAAALAEGIHRILPDADCVEIPMADGGEGFTEALSDALGAQRVEVPLRNAVGEPTTGTIAVTADRAVMEVAEAVGIGMVSAERRRIRAMHSFGVGQLILAALDQGVTEILIGLGGSGTNDAGAGMLRALGCVFYADDDVELDGSPNSLTRLARIDTSGLDPRLEGVAIKVACDVDNPLLGARGASAVFGPQKGASPEDVAFLDEALKRFAGIAGDLDGPALAEGAGAAGGLGYALVAFLGAELSSGIELVVQTVGLRDAVEGADFVFTGEGAMDRQTLMGKTLSGVAKVAVPAGVPIVAFAGKLGDGVEELYDHGFVALMPIVDGVTDLAGALANGRVNLANASERAVRLIMAGRTYSAQ